MTIVTTNTATTPGAGIVGASPGGQAAGGATAGFEALLAAFFGETTTVAPTQGAGAALAAAGATPVLMNGDFVLGAEEGLNAEAPLVADILATDGEAATDGQATTVVDPSLPVDVAALVAPQQPTPTVAAQADANVAIDADAAAKTPAAATAVTPEAAAQAATDAVAMETPAPHHTKTKAAPASHASAPGSAHGHAEGKVEGPDTEVAAELPEQAAVAKPTAQPEHAKAAAQARAPQAPAAQNAQPPAAAAATSADPIELPSSAIAAATDASAEAAPEQAATPALTGAAQDVTTAAAGRAAAQAARPRDAKDQAKTEPQGDKVEKADAKDAFRAVSDAFRKGGAAATAPQTKTEGAERKDPEAETKVAETGEAHVEEAHTQARDERVADTRGPNAAAQHPVRGSPETVANLAAQIVKKLNGKATRFDLELTPHGMGTVDVRIEIQNGRVTAAMMFDNPQAAAEMKARAAELQRSLEAAGFDLSGGLSFEAKDGGDTNRGWRQAQDQNDGRGMRGKAFQNAFDTASEAADIADSGALRLRRGVTSNLDVRV